MAVFYYNGDENSDEALFPCYNLFGGGEAVSQDHFRGLPYADEEDQGNCEKEGCHPRSHEQD
jgi:hypothetical protein